MDAFHDTAIRAQEGDLKTFGGTNQNLPVCARYQNPQRTPFTEWFHENFTPNVLVPMSRRKSRKLQPHEEYDYLHQYLDKSDTQIMYAARKASMTQDAHLQSLLVDDIRPDNRPDISDEELATWRYNKATAHEYRMLIHELSELTPKPIMKVALEEMVRDGLAVNPSTFEDRYRSVADRISSTVQWSELNLQFFLKLVHPWLNTSNLGTKKIRDTMDELSTVLYSETDQLEPIRKRVEAAEKTTMNMELAFRELANRSQTLHGTTVDPVLLNIGLGLPASADGSLPSTDLAPPKTKPASEGRSRAETTLNGQRGIYTRGGKVFLPLCNSCTTQASRPKYHNPSHCPKAKKDDEATTHTAAGSEKGAGSKGKGKSGGDGSNDQLSQLVTDVSKCLAMMQKPPGISELVCWNCGEKGHGYCECPKSLSIALQQRLTVRPIEKDRRDRYLAAHPMKGKTAKAIAVEGKASGSTSTASVADLQQQLAKVTAQLQAMQGTDRGSTSLAKAAKAERQVHWPDMEDFEATDDSSDSGTIAHMQGYDQVAKPPPMACAMLQLGSALAEAGGHSQYGVKGMKWRRTAASEAEPEQQTSAAPTSPTPQAAQPPPAPSTAAPRPRGRPRVLPRGNQRDPGRRMEVPGWDQQRSMLDHRPVGFEPAGMQPDAAPATHGTAADRAPNRESRQLRREQIYHALKASLQNARFRNLDVSVVTNTDEHTRRLWNQARNQALLGVLDSRDPYSVAWDAALQGCAAHFFAAAKLQLYDLLQDFSAIYRAAVQAVFGITLPQEAEFPWELPDVAALEGQGQNELRQSEPVHTLPALPAPAPPVVPALTSPLPEADHPREQMSVDEGGSMARTLGPTTVASMTELAHSLSQGQPAQLQRTLCPVTARKPLAPMEWEARRQQWRAHTGRQPVYRRPGCSNIRMDLTTIEICGIPVKAALLDGGADVASLNKSFADRLPPHIRTMLASFRMTGIHGTEDCKQLRGPGLEVAINPGTTWGRVVEHWPRFAILDSPDLPDIIIDTSLMGALGVFQLYDGHHAFYQLDPDSGMCGEIPLERAAWTARAVALLDTLRKPPTTAVSPVWGGEGSLSNPAAQAGPVNSFIEDTGHVYAGMSRDAGLAFKARIPSWSDQRKAKGPALDALRSKVTASRLAAIPALPHSTREKVYVADLQRYGGKAGAQRELHVCAGDLTTLAQRLKDGVHMEDVQVLDIKYQDSRERQRAHCQLQWLHCNFPDELPKRAIADCFRLARIVNHDASKLTAPLILEHCGRVDHVAVEFPCTDTSSLGYQLGLRGNRTGIIVPIAEWLADLQFIMAMDQGFSDWGAAPAQFGWTIENVDFRPTERSSPEVREAFDWMKRVFGEPVSHEIHLDGDPTARTSLWWCNMFTQEYYHSVRERFHRPLNETFEQVVHEMSEGKLAVQIASEARPHTLMGGLNQEGERMIVAPKMVSRPDTQSQRVDPETGQPGAGMLEVVGSVPRQYVRCPAIIRERLLNAPSGFYTRPELGRTEDQMVRAIGNICAPSSVSCITRVQVAYAHQRGFEAWLRLQAKSLHLDEVGQLKAVKSVGRTVIRGAVGAVDPSAEAHRVVTATKRQLSGRAPGVRQFGDRLMKSGRRFHGTADAEARAAERRSALARRQAAAMLPQVQRGLASRASTVKLSKPLWNVLRWLSVVTTACVTAYGLGTNAGLAVLASQAPQPHALCSCSAEHDSTVIDEALAQCYAHFANEQFTGKAEPTVKLPSKLINLKDGSRHEWEVSESFGRAAEFAAMMDEHPDTYAWTLKGLKPVKADPYEFELVDSNPVFKRQYHLAKREQDFADEWVKDLEAAGMVREINSPYAAPVVVAPKKDESGAWSDLRYAIDYRGLNEKTVRDQYPCPTAEEIMARMEGATRITTCDAFKAFHQLPVSEKCQKSMAFHAGNRLMTWTRMPFGQTNSVAAWQRVMDAALRGIPYAAAYADDVIIWSGDDEMEHIERVRTVMAALRNAGIQVAAKKCHLGLRRIEFLGHIVGAGGVEPMYSKVDAINKLPPPKSATEVRAFLGMATYYCRFIPAFHKYKGPLTALTKKDCKWGPQTWGPDQQEAFQQIKDLLVSSKVMRNPNWDKPFILHTDWSKSGVGATLSQVDDDGIEYAIAYASRTNSPAEQSFCSYEGEVSAVHYAVQRFRYYLWGRRFKLITDCKAMQWLRTTAKLRSKLARWSLLLAEYDFEIVHRAGKDNVVPDLLSRHPMEDLRMAEDTDGSRAGAANYLAQHPAPTEQLHRFATLQAAVAFVAGTADALALTEDPGTRDIYESPVALSFVRGELNRTDVPSAQWTKLQSRWRAYSYARDKVWRTIGKHGALKLEVPPPEERVDIIKRVHHKIGHLGRDRTYHMVSRYYWWPGMHAQVAAVLKQCLQCDRVRSTFSVKHDRLKPMPIFGMFYRFSIDSAGPFRPSSTGMQYVIVIVEHFSKWIELAAIPELNPAQTARAFQERVLARYGAPVELVSDNGQEYHGEFSDLLRRHGVDQLEIPAGRPSTNGMAERMVKVLKSALKKFVENQGTLTWDSWLPVIEFGYRVTRQASTGYSPYFLMYGRDHVAPAQVRAMLSEPVDVEDEEAALHLISQRADVLRSAMPQAFERALDAQRRDAVRYKKVRRGDVQPRVHRFAVGEFVYLAQVPINSLDVSTSRTILQVREVRPSGILVLEGSDGRQLSVHMDQCAPCHLSNLVPVKRGALPQASVPACASCGSNSRASPMLVCDKCDRYWHTACVGERVQLAPSEEWLCPTCAPATAAALATI